MMLSSAILATPRPEIDSIVDREPYISIHSLGVSFDTQRRIADANHLALDEILEPIATLSTDDAHHTRSIQLITQQLATWKHYVTTYQHRSAPIDSRRPDMLLIFEEIECQSK